VVICLERGADLHTAQLMPPALSVSCFSQMQLVLPFWHRLTRVVPDKEPLNGCVCVCVTDEILFAIHGNSSLINSKHYVKLYPQNGDRIVTNDFATSFHPMSTAVIRWSV